MIARRTIIGTGGALAVLVLLFVALLSDPHAARAQPTGPGGAPTPAPTRDAGWYNEDAGSVPEGLPQAAKTTGTLYNYTFGQLCSALPVTGPGNVPQWTYAPADGTLIIDPYGERAPAEVRVEECSQISNLNANYVLIAPDGSAIPLQLDNFTGGFFVELEPNSPPGTYRLVISSSVGTYEVDFKAQPYADARIRILDAATGAPIRSDITGPIRVDYSGFGSEEILNVGLYRAREGISIVTEYELVDGWQIAPTAAGTYSEVLTVPAYAPPGVYAIAACSAFQCRPQLAGGELQLSIPAATLVLATPGGTPPIGENPPPISEPGPAAPGESPPVGPGGSAALMPARITIPAGRFFMGSDAAQVDAAVAECNRDQGDCQRDWFGGELPGQVVELDVFQIDQYEVTNAQFVECIAAGACRPAGSAIGDGGAGLAGANLPVVLVTWNDAVRFCQWAGGRLPTEAEWEKAARGTDGRRYPWGNRQLQSYANLASAGPSSVGSYPAGASPYGLLDMAGNVFEWTATPASNNRYILKGGSWNNYAFRGRVADRGTKLVPDSASNDIGFRCAYDP